MNDCNHSWKYRGSVRDFHRDVVHYEYHCDKCDLTYISDMFLHALQSGIRPVEPPQGLIDKEPTP